ncbi:LON peptidase substrate-binding domain-containing protein [Candidatus Albibeggiatoa sp. nov. NOAA]|uniref:LON peptidase substrate-binding domain-containing protein n=1 Tax=Candidatus Albibeggiatoa sp. nov. NOAA TaxID=3162724 RepID=UPI0032F3F68F|nr:LON peptidase substrate-binding domain-containing protein [Thiotrichaceae bacterium]
MHNDTITIPLFPLHSVLFPDGLLPLRIFEPRYLDMVSQCLKQDALFGISLIYDGKEVGEAALTHNIGTMAKIVDWDKEENGLLVIKVVGQQKFKILSQETKKNQLIEAKVELFPSEDSATLTPEYQVLSDLLEQIIQQLGNIYPQISLDYNNAHWVSYRLAELLPISLVQRQKLLELSDPAQRLAILKQSFRD